MVHDERRSWRVVASVAAVDLARVGVLYLAGLSRLENVSSAGQKTRRCANHLWRGAVRLVAQLVAVGVGSEKGVLGHAGKPDVRRGWRCNRL